MTCPPNPGLTAALLEALRSMDFNAMNETRGRVVGAYLTVTEGAAVGTVRWSLAAELPAGCGARLISREAWDALRAGTLAEDGTLLHDGKRYRLADLWTDEPYTGLPCADLVEVR